MAKLGWGTPTLISVSLGVIIEIPGNIAILGVLSVALPTDDEPVIVLQVNFVGAIEFDKQARLVLRRAVRVAHPLHHARRRDGPADRVRRRPELRAERRRLPSAFTPPPLPFPTPKRLALNILNER